MENGGKHMKFNGYDIVARAILHYKDTHPTIIGDHGGYLPKWALCDHCGVSREWLTSYLLIDRHGKKFWVADHCLPDILDSEEDALAAASKFVNPEGVYCYIDPWVSDHIIPAIATRIFQGMSVDNIQRDIILRCMTGYSKLEGYDDGLIIAKLKAEHEARPPESQHVGTVGKRRIGRLTLTKILGPYSGQWADRYGYFFTQGNDVLVWWSSTDPHMDIGESADFKYTIKSHDDYNGKKQTQISAAKRLEKNSENSASD
jgi:hypothetical protein